MMRKMAQPTANILNEKAKQTLIFLDNANWSLYKSRIGKPIITKSVMMSMMANTVQKAV